MKIKAGQIVMTSSGSYSDYGVHDHFRVLADFDSAEQEQLYRDETGKNGISFEGWMIHKGLWEPTAAGEILEWWLDTGYGIAARQERWSEPTVFENEFYRNERLK